MELFIIIVILFVLWFINKNTRKHRSIDKFTDEIHDNELGFGNRLMYTDNRSINKFTDDNELGIGNILNKLMLKKS